MSTRIQGDARAVASAVERQMRRWALEGQAQRQAAADETVARMGEEIHPYVAISREAGTGGEAIAQLVARELGCRCLDRELLTALAEHYQVPAHVIAVVDEKTSHFLLELVGRWIDRRAINRDDYLTRLGRIMMLAAQHETTVFVGRGGQFLLPRERGLAVRIIAPLEWRLERVRRERDLGGRDPRKVLDEIDRGRRELIARYFRQDIDAPSLYDLEVNVERLGDEGAARVIATGFRQRFGIA